MNGAPTPNGMPPAKPRCADEDQKLAYDVIDMILSRQHHWSLAEVLKCADYIIGAAIEEDDDA